MKFIIERSNGKVLAVDADIAKEKDGKVFFYKERHLHQFAAQQQFYPIERILVASIADYKCFYMEAEIDK